MDRFEFITQSPAMIRTESITFDGNAGIIDCAIDFPAVQSGGIQMLKAWQGPFGDVRFCPTGGISPANAAEFLALSNVVCVGGSWLVPSSAVEAGNWSQITDLAKATHALRA